MSSSNLHLGLRLGDLTTPAFQRLYYHQQLHNLEHDTSYSFDHRSQLQSADDEETHSRPQAHTSGTNCLTVDQITGQCLVSGGADTTVRLWDLQNTEGHDDEQIYRPAASLTKGSPGFHTHSLTSVSVYSHNATPTTLLSTSYDTTLLLTAIQPERLQPLHKFTLDHAVYTQALSPIPGGISSTLVAAGTAHSSVRLLDLRSGLATHSLPGHQGEIWGLAWHPKQEHVLISSGMDGRILVFDIRRASPAFASFDVDDAAGVLESSQSRQHLNYQHRAHSAPITGIVVNARGDKLISSAQDSRIRVWDMATGKNDLVYFGPRIRNSRTGHFAPVLAPSAGASGEGTVRGAETMFWSNDDGKGEIMVLGMRDGRTMRTMRTQGIKIGEEQASRGAPLNRGRGGRGAALRAGMVAANRMSRRGRINAMCFRPVEVNEGGIELYTGHGDGSINVWRTTQAQDVDDEIDDDNEIIQVEDTIDEQERSRKRKRDLLGDLVQGLTKKSVLLH